MDGGADSRLAPSFVYAYAWIQYDYTKGQLPELTDVLIKNKIALFVCAVGVPPMDMVDKLHKAGILVMK